MTDRKSTIMSMVGEVLGNYRITAPIDRGGMGNVFRAEHTHLGRPAAVKLLRSELTGNDALVQRFFNEAKAATAIRHPGIVDVYDFGYTEDGRAYFAMELLEGESLGKRIAKGRFSERETVRVGRGLVSVLKAAHAKGIIHRDLKPDNIFLVSDEDEGERVKVLDFGVAKLSDFPAEMRHTQTGMLMGTPLYMAPEQARAAGAIDHRADLYSVGCLLYEMLSGEPPFKAEGAGEIIALQMFADPQPLRDRLTQITPEVEALVLKLLAKEPDERYQSAADLHTALGVIKDSLAGEVSTERENSQENRPRMTRALASTPPPIVAKDVVRTPLTLLDERPDQRNTKSSMPLVAAGVMVGIAGVVAILIFVVRGSSKDDVKTPVDAAVVAPIVAPAPTDPARAPAPTPPREERPPAPTATAVTSPTPATPTMKPTDPTKQTAARINTTAVPVTRPEGAPRPTTSAHGAITTPGVVLVDGAPAEVRTPITNSPLTTDLDEKPPEPEPTPP